MNSYISYTVSKQSNNQFSDLSIVCRPYFRSIKRDLLALQHQSCICNLYTLKEPFHIKNMPLTTLKVIEKLSNMNI